VSVSRNEIALVEEKDGPADVLMTPATVVTRDGAFNRRDRKVREETACARSTRHAAMQDLDTR
jgi:hypothetical protein